MPDDAFSLTVDGRDYRVHVVDESNFDQHEAALERLAVCDETYISRSYEAISYTSLQLPGYVGFFLTDAKGQTPLASLILDLGCDQLLDRMGAAAAQAPAVCIALLCAHPKHKVPNLTAAFVAHTLRTQAPRHKPGVQQVLLYVSKGRANTTAVRFYQRLGFQFVKHGNIEEPNLMAAPLSSIAHQGGAKRSTHKHKRNRQSKRTRKGINARNRNRNKRLTTRRTGRSRCRHRGPRAPGWPRCSPPAAPAGRTCPPGPARRQTGRPGWPAPCPGTRTAPAP